MVAVLLRYPLVEPLDPGEIPPPPLILPSGWVASGAGTTEVNLVTGGLLINSPGSQTKLTYAVDTEEGWNYIWTYRAAEGTGQRAIGTTSSLSDVVSLITTPAPSLVTVNFLGTGSTVYLQLLRSSTGLFRVEDVTLEEIEPTFGVFYLTDEDGNRLTDEDGNLLYIPGSSGGAIEPKIYLTDESFNILTTDDGERLYIDA